MAFDIFNDKLEQNFKVRHVDENQSESLGTPAVSMLRSTRFVEGLALHLPYTISDSFSFYDFFFFFF